MNMNAYLELSAGEQEIRARRVAQVAHAGVFNEKNGEPYIAHPARIVEHSRALCAARGCAPIEAAWVVAAGWLHDTVEDTPITIGWLTDMGLPDIAIHMVSLLTRRGEVSDEDYYAAPIAGHELARLAKLAE